MIFYNDLDYQKLDKIINNCLIIKQFKKPSLLNLSCSFDIETTSTYVNDEKVAFMYIWMFQIEDICVYGRNFEQYKEFLEMISERYELGSDKNLVVYVQNLSYEFQFIRKHFNWLNVFAVDERKAIKATDENGIQYKDSYILSGYSLENIAKNLVSHKIKKLVGYLDYKKVRTEKTKLSKKELDYCEYDVRIIVYYIREQIEEFGDIGKIPLTNTGRVRNYVRDKCLFTSKNHRKSSTGKFNRYRKLMNNLTLSLDNYKQCLRAFGGGFTHANANYVNQTLNNVSSIDFTSSYPSVMVTEKYPMSEPIKLEVNTLKDLEEVNKKYCVVMDIQFTNIISKIHYENYISESKCWKLEKPTINNGRIVKADLLQTTITNVDYDIIKNCYEWENVKVLNVTGYLKGYLPKPIIESILKLYKDKTTLKGVKGKEVEYMRSKGMLNSVYGMCVTNIIQENHKYSDGEWLIENIDEQEQLEKYNNSKKRFLYYVWGIFVTAYARKNLWSGILSFKDDYIYSDTDSIKCLNYDQHTDYINKYNQLIEIKIKKMCNHYKLDHNEFKPKTIKGVTKMIGVWDYEGTYTTFKTLGAKRYLVEEDGELQLTVAGLSKNNGINYMKEKYGSTENVFKMFNDNLYIPSNRTGKNTHTYIDSEKEFYICDYQNNETHVKTLSGVHLEECDFTLNIAKQYGEFLLKLKQGFIYKGVEKVL